MGTGQISMPGNTAQMGYDYLGQMTSRKVTLTATPFRPNRSLFPMTVARASPTPTLFWGRLNRFIAIRVNSRSKTIPMGPRRRPKGRGSKQIGRVLITKVFSKTKRDRRLTENYKATLTKYRAGRSEDNRAGEDLNRSFGLADRGRPREC